MKQNNLRIGNLVKDDEGNIVKVERINSDNIKEFTIVSKDGKLYPSNIYPIKLTEQWFKDFGFFDIVYAFDMNIERELLFRVIVTKGGFYPSVIQEPEVSNECVSIVGLQRLDYVNDLQNLWYALKGEELELVQLKKINY
ncbi:MAG TPA: hypothetical protein VN192_02530 [Flavobacterium sp.]|nr:hypothetical protein [Flavobacterium sp.]